jgi:hypothetical protein
MAKNYKVAKRKAFDAMQEDEKDLKGLKNLSKKIKKN